MRLSFRGEREAREIRRNAGEREKWMSGEKERTTEIIQKWRATFYNVSTIEAMINVNNVKLP